MRIHCAVGHLHEIGLWEKFCSLTGTAIDAMENGQYDPRDSVLLPEDMWADAAEHLVKPTNNRGDDEKA